MFLTNTVALAHQQAECISKTTPLKVSVYTGDMNVDAWRHDRWYGEFDDNQVNKRISFNSPPIPWIFFAIFLRIPSTYLHIIF